MSPNTKRVKELVAELYEHPDMLYSVEEELLSIVSDLELQVTIAEMQMQEDYYA